LWAKICKDDLGAKNPKSMMLRGIFGGGGGGLTIAEPENNIIRTAYYALSSALSGTQTMALCCYDEAYTIPSEKASRIGLRTMQILQEEVGVCDTVDPLAGSYYVEWLTDEMERRIVAEMERVDELGGIVENIQSGYIQRLVSRQAYEEEVGIRKGEIPKVAVNRYPSDEKASRDVQLHEPNPAAQNEQVERLTKVKAERDGAEVARTLGVLREKAALPDENLMPHLMGCIRAYCTVGEMSGVFKDVFGEFDEPIDL
jgi:methylmalonyl-CoA mutase N-terminal domain/subunit